MTLKYVGYASRLKQITVELNSESVHRKLSNMSINGRNLRSIKSVQNRHQNFRLLRAIDSKYGESNDSSENSDFLLVPQKYPFGELFSEIYFKSSSELTFF